MWEERTKRKFEVSIFSAVKYSVNPSAVAKFKTHIYKVDIMIHLKPHTSENVVYMVMVVLRFACKTSIG